MKQNRFPYVALNYTPKNGATTPIGFYPMRGASLRQANSVAKAIDAVLKAWHYQGLSTNVGTGIFPENAVELPPLRVTTASVVEEWTEKFVPLPIDVQWAHDPLQNEGFWFEIMSIQLDLHISR